MAGSVARSCCRNLLVLSGSASRSKTDTAPDNLWEPLTGRAALADPRPTSCVDIPIRPLDVGPVVASGYIAAAATPDAVTGTYQLTSSAPLRLRGDIDMRDTINAIYRTSLKRARASIAALLIAGSALAADLPSDLTGTYVGSESLVGWQCEIKAFEIRTDSGSSRALTGECQTPAGRVSGGKSTNLACASTDETDFELVPWSCHGPLCLSPANPEMKVLSYSPATAQCVLGQVVVTVGTGPATVMCRTQIIVPTYPYPGCGAAAPEPLPQPPPAPRYPRLCRQFGLYCGR